MPVIKTKFSDCLQEIYILYRSLADPDVPWYVKVFIGLVIAYILSPIDLIPDFIPVLGMLDEVILIPIAIKIAIKLMPAEPLQKYRDTTIDSLNPDKKLIILGIAMVALIWLAAISTVWLLVK